MDVWRITVATLRRWYIFLPLLALTAGAVFVVGQGVQPEYEVSGTALITPGRTPSPVPNPYGGEQQASAAVAIVLNSTESRAGVQAAGLLPAYEVAGRSRSTILNVAVRGGDADQAVETARHVLELAGQELAERQGGAGIPSSAQYGLDILAAPALAGVVYDGKMQVQAVTGLLGASLALLVAVLFDDIVGLFRRRRARRRADPAGAAPTVAAEGAPSTDGTRSRDPERPPRSSARDHARA
ncbi:hypothetical protein FE251_13160 [Georgenia wutianyii]|uniref:Polysaccharide chain length determinant N-terminal domain-containing protein n=1 Tax=Georgenia wutianyii TaxID=2585135 RepID=A0ABX5VPV3_9MICO|nr:hypothetical protein [Georgenia wutianyii]QDB80223.1 hypothetical protein FE251_13160 [Georgenia wutianyii]